MTIVKAFGLAAVGAALALASAASAGNLVQNGGFEVTQGGVYGVSTADSLAANGNASLWAPNGGNTDAAVADWDITWGSIGGVFVSDALTNAGQWGYYGYYGASQNYGSSYLQYTAGLGVDPNGGNFVGLDGDHYGGSLTQTITGLAPGQQYLLTFYQAADHYQGWGDFQSSQFIVGLGSQTQAAPVMSTTAGGTPWTKISMIFTATSGSEVLSFMDQGV